MRVLYEYYTTNTLMRYIKAIDDVRTNALHVLVLLHFTQLQCVHDIKPIKRITYH